MRGMIWLLTVGLTLVACGVRAQPEGSSAVANQALVREAFTAFEQGDIATLNRIFDPDGPWHTPSGGTIRQGGPFADLKGSCPMCAALAQRRITIEVMLAEGDLVAVRSTWSGAYTGVFRGVPVTGKPVTLIFSNIYRVSGGRIRENWADADRLSLADQLGLKLTPAEAAK